VQQDERPAAAGAAVREAAGLAEFDVRVHAATVPAARGDRRGRSALAGSLRRMDARSIAGLQALGRLGLGAGLVLAPGVFAGGWVGGVADRREGQTLAIAAGARDVAIALGALRALERRGGAAGWVRAGLLADAADAYATWRARDSLPALAAPAVLAIAGGSAALGLWLQSAVD
jgi:hypothetical protein